MTTASRFDHRALPYGVYLCADGSQVIHDRKYRPLVKCRGGSLSLRAQDRDRQPCTLTLDTDSATPCSPTERIEHINHAWFYDDGTSPRFDRKTRKHLQQIVEAIPALAAEINRRMLEAARRQLQDALGEALAAAVDVAGDINDGE